MSNEDLRAHILTRGAYYRGAVHYSDIPSASAPRLQDFLNTVARGRQPGAVKSTVPTIRLDGVEITVYRGGGKTTVMAPTVSIVAASIVVAFDEGQPVRRDTIPPVATYEVRMAQHNEPVVVLTRTRHRIAGKVRGGLKRLTTRTADEPFIAVTSVSIEDLTVDGRAPAELPFVALNMDFVESFWMG